MAFKQPKVPEYRGTEKMEAYIHKLTLFLRDFCQEAWNESRLAGKTLEKVRGDLSGIAYPVNSVNGKTGNVVLSAGDVGARPNTWTPTAAAVGALAAGGTAVNSGKLEGKTWAQVLSAIYPVGAIYLSVTSTSPASLFGGTWEQIKGRFLLATGSPQANTDGSFGHIFGVWDAPPGSTGGQDHHTLTTAEMPAHGHTMVRPKWYSGDNNVASDSEGAIYGVQNSTTKSYYSTATDLWAVGGGAAHNNMPPYLAVYMWKRVS